MKKIFKLTKFLKDYKYFVLLSFIFSLISVACMLYIPIQVGIAIDNIIDANNVNFDVIKKEILIILLLALNSVMYSYLQNRINNKISYSLSKKLKSELITKINVLSINYLDKTPTGEIQSIMTSDIDQACDGINLALNQFISGILTIIITLILMFTINVYLTLVVIALTPLSLIISTIVSKMIYKYFKNQSIARGNLSSYIEEVFEKQKTVKSYNYEEFANERFDELNENLSKESIKAVFYSSCVNPTTRLINNIIYASIILISSLLMIKSNNIIISIGSLSTLLAYSTQYAKPFNEISGVISELSNSAACLSRVENILSQENDVDKGKQELPDKDLPKEISFNNVYFSYTKTQKLIENFSLDVKPGEHIAIVGKTGSGKTTLINLLLRFYDVNEGSINMNNMDINSIPKQELRRHFGMVLQETWLKNASIKDNISFGSNASFEDIEKAAKITHADNFIKKLPNDYDTIVSNSDENISIGEKQLICITRVLLNNPEMLILDEATSNIDLISEKQIQKDIDILMEGKTSFVVAHRLSTIINSDKIVVMKDGNIEEIGSHPELLNNNGYYKELFMSQFN